VINILFTEFMKLKRSKILWLIPAAGLIPVIVMIPNAFNNLSFKVKGWPYFIADFLLTMNQLIPSVFILFTGYVFSREYQDNTISFIYSHPVSRVSILISKMVLLIPVIFATIFLSFISILCLGGLILPDSITADILICI
jgi:bacitracin transport system permease protein